MHALLERLGRGDTRLLEMFAKANQEWRDFLSELDTADTGTIGARLGFFQPRFEKLFEGKELGQSMMPWTGFACLYDTQSGWGRNQPKALQLIQAFARSNCSAEVKEEARAAAISYSLDKHPDFPKVA
ncbi:MAG: hypothetical protein GC206_08155 [Alphaproteobacteria bacterium]|nr:hypothetical protein [Alphaproteobacteria bacterium]